MNRGLEHLSNVPNYLKTQFVVENVVSGDKRIISTMREFVSLAGDDKAAARAFINEGQEQQVGDVVARKMESFETF